VDLTKKIGLRVREERNRQRLSLAALSVRTGGVLSKSRISNYEQGLRRMGIEEAQALSTALGVSATYLLCLDDAGFLSEEERVLIEQFRRADARGRATLLALAEVEGKRG
jgi:transcriptional regulator with XRE-family HTH domain